MTTSLLVLCAIVAVVGIAYKWYLTARDDGRDVGEASALKKSVEDLLRANEAANHIGSGDDVAKRVRSRFSRDGE